MITVRFSAVVLGSLAILIGASSASGSSSARFSGRINPPPAVQNAGQTYRVGITVRTGSTKFSHFCIDFEDDHNSWVTRMPGLRAYDDDVFCFGKLRAHVTKKFSAFITAAKTGAHKLEVGLGQAHIYKSINDAVLDEHSLWWNDQFVIVG